MEEILGYCRPDQCSEAERVVRYWPGVTVQFKLAFAAREIVITSDSYICVGDIRLMKLALTKLGDGFVEFKG